MHFKTPWKTGMIAFLFGAASSMCYLGWGRLVLMYLGAILAANILLHGHIYLLLKIVLAIQMAGFIHCLRIFHRMRNVPVPKKWFSRWYVILPVFLLSASPAALLFRSYGYEFFHIPTGSMLPTIHKDDYLWVSKSAYLLQGPQRGDVVVFRHPKRDVNFIKRIIGLPGEKIQVKHGVVFISGMALKQEPVSGTQKLFMEDAWQRKPHTIWMEHPESPMENTLVYVVPAHYYFVMGDNRDHSQDSRVESLGCVPEANILGKAVVTWWNGGINQFKPLPIN